MPFKNNFEGVFSLDVNEWRGRKSLQLMIHCIQDPSLDLELDKESTNSDSLVLSGAASMQKKDIGRVKTENKKEDVAVPF
ncbi:hypothetical protein D3C85_1743760 [compost metagenome]